MNTVSLQDTGKKLLHSVERLLDSDEVIVRDMSRLWNHAHADRHEACRQAISEYSNKSALAGAIAAAPGVVPGFGTAAVVSATVLEMAYVMKTEVEMCLGLSVLLDFDIKNPEHRQVAYFLAALGTHEIATDRNKLADYGEVGVAAVWNYAPRELSKVVLELFGKLATLKAAQKLGTGVLRAIPFVGIGVGAGLNKAMTAKVGRRAHGALNARVAYLAKERSR